MYLESAVYRHYSRNTIELQYLTGLKENKEAPGDMLRRVMDDKLVLIRGKCLKKGEGHLPKTFSSS